MFLQSFRLVCVWLSVEAEEIAYASCRAWRMTSYLTHEWLVHLITTFNNNISLYFGYNYVHASCSFCNRCKQLQNLLETKESWQPVQSFILAGFILSLPRSDPCGSEHLIHTEKWVRLRRSTPCATILIIWQLFPVYSQHFDLNLVCDRDCSPVKVQLTTQNFMLPSVWSFANTYSVRSYGPRLTISCAHALFHLWYGPRVCIKLLSLITFFRCLGVFSMISSSCSKFQIIAK